MLLSVRPALLRARRGAGVLQLGAAPGRSVVLTGLDARDEQLIAALDGTLDLPALLDRAAALGVAAPRARQLLESLLASGVLRAREPGTGGRGRSARPPRRSGGEQRALVPDAQLLALAHPAGDGWRVLGGRWRAGVHVVGASRTGLAVALGLAAAGVGRVVVDDASPVLPGDVSPGGYGVEDVGRPRGERAAQLLRARCPLVLTEPAEPPVALPTQRRGDDAEGADDPEDADRARDEPPGRPPAAPPAPRPDAVVLVAAGAVHAGAGDALVRDAVPHLSVLWREATTVVGPLVSPGATACLRCLDAHRTDRDPEWPRVARQLAGPLPGTRTRPEETALAALAGSLAVLQVLAQLDGVERPAALGATLEASLPEGLVTRRPWPPHPRCGCTWSGGR